MALNPTEEFVARVCQRTFLKLWSYENPRSRDPGKELCDILIICDPHVVIISVAGRELPEGKVSVVDWKRWERKVVKHCLDQISGAERELAELTHVIKADGTEGLPLPPVDRRTVHRLAVVLGGKNQIPIAASGDEGRFVHVMEENAFELILKELDTISDLLKFMDDLEAYLDNTQVITAGLENLLASYLSSGRVFPSGATILFVDDGAWDAYKARPEVKRKEQEDEISYLWDRLIDSFADEILSQSSGDPSRLAAAEPAIRVMARENRFSRRVLSQGFSEFCLRATRGEAKSRFMESPSGIVYVFLATPASQARADRIDELKLRCFVARGLRGSNPVVGIATEAPQASPDPRVELLFYDKPDWTSDDQANLEKVQQETRVFVTPEIREASVDEYPTDDDERHG